MQSEVQAPVPKDCGIPFSSRGAPARAWCIIWSKVCPTLPAALSSAVKLGFVRIDLLGGQPVGSQIVRVYPDLVGHLQTEALKVEALSTSKRTGTLP